MPPTVEVFEPADFSIQELQFLLEHLEESPTMALHDRALPKGVNPDAIRPALERWSQLEELAQKRKLPWAGYAPIRDSITRFIAFQERCVQGNTQGDVRHPSQFRWDSMGMPAKYGIGTDSAEKVRTELRPDGARVPFAVQLTGTAHRKSSIWATKTETVVADDTILLAANGTLTCSICNKVVASFDPERGTRVKNKALAEARKHCMQAQTEQGRHRAIANVPII